MVKLSGLECIVTQLKAPKNCQQTKKKIPVGMHMEPTHYTVYSHCWHSDAQCT